jgi:hypothetical protein
MEKTPRFERENWRIILAYSLMTKEQKKLNWLRTPLTEIEKIAIIKRMEKKMLKHPKIEKIKIEVKK